MSIKNNKKELKDYWNDLTDREFIGSISIEKMKFLARLSGLIESDGYIKAFPSISTEHTPSHDDPIGFFFIYTKKDLECICFDIETMGFGRPKINKGIHGMCVYVHPSLVVLLNFLGLQNENNIPNWIHESPSSVKREFLNAFCSNNCKPFFFNSNLQPPRIESYIFRGNYMTEVNPESYLHDLIDLIASLGILVYYDAEKQLIYLNPEYENLNKFSDLIYFRYCLKKQKNNYSFIEYIKTILAGTFYSFKTFLKLFLHPEKKSHITTYIKSIKDIPLELVYDFTTISHTHSFVANSFISHNCIPSRMTISQLIECIMSKTACSTGKMADATPFRPSTTDISHEICKDLGKTGQNRYGYEQLVNGFTGELMDAQIFIGPVYYQRLKHLVSEKIHARSTGPVTTFCRQPLDGRSRGGGLRFGEMEKDCTVDVEVATECGLSIMISQMKNCDDIVYGWSEKENGLVARKQIGWMSKGVRECMEVTMEDGRKLEFTPEHKMLTHDNKWIEVKDLIANQTKLKVGLTSPIINIDEEIIECNGWTMIIGNIELRTHTKTEYFRTLAFMRLLGLIITDGHITEKRKCRVFLGHNIDTLLVANDIKLFCEFSNDSIRFSSNIYEIRIPQYLINNILTLDGFLRGSKINQEGLLPSFIKNTDIPRPICREFLASMFGGDGHSSALSSHNRGNLEKTEIKNKNDLVTSISFSRTKILRFIESLTENLTCIASMINKCGVGLDINGQNKITLQTPKETTSSKKKRKTESDIEASYEQVLHIPFECFIDFHEKIGSRYCIQKQLKNEATYSYKKMYKTVETQRIFIIKKTIEEKNKGNVKNITKCINKIVEDLEKTETIIHPCSIPTPKNVSDFNRKQTDFFKFRHGLFPSPGEYFEKIGVLKWFEKGSYVVERELNALPTMEMKVIAIRPVGLKPVYDIEVDEIHSFLANGIVAHNCIVAHGSTKFLKERLFENSDPYQVSVCNLCGCFATSRDYCKSCDNNVIPRVNLPYASKLLIHELQAMNIKIAIFAKK